MNRKALEALDSLRVKTDLLGCGIKIDWTEEEYDVFLDVYNWAVKGNFNCPKCGQLLNKRLVKKRADEEEVTRLCPYCLEKVTLQI